MNKIRTMATVGMLLAATALPAVAVPTAITVRVVSKGAKFVGTSMGGVLVTIKDADTGELLAKGVTRGDTGDTKRIMVAEHKRGDALSSEGASKFTATLDLAEPRRIEVTAYGPLAQRQAGNTVSATQWVVPGKGITEGDGWLLELPGMIVDVQAPSTHVKLKGVPQSVKIEANVTMMCGCPIEAGGLWDANKIEVKALLRRNGEAAGELSLKYAGTTSQFAGTWDVNKPGTYEATVYAYDPANGNTGLDHVTFMVTE